MFLFYIFVLIPLIKASDNYAPSYRSSVMDGDKPILRMPPNSESEPEEDLPPSQTNREDAKMVKDVGILIEWLEDNFGYDLATARKHNTEGEKPHKKHKKKNSKEKKPNNSDPVWVRELKDYLKDLTTRFKQQDIASYTNPIIASIEKKHDVKINDIDVDQYGEISINYTELKKEKKEKKKKKSSKGK
ncbi:uncharacterized protein LOC110379174 [Helicoverpa armigera]|uniref:uncharacterized protein LOC110379174 n=1 Tax=Helicoverpa armigera TaxID=29058 RepID=UPI0030827496